MKLHPANISYIGQRSEQQDRLGWYGFNNPEFSKHGGILGYVCDGMGGMKNGGMAATVAGQALVASYQAKSASAEISESLKDALTAANAAVCKLTVESGLKIGEIGTTLSAIVVHHNRLYWISVGDSRVYLLRGRNLIQLTTDHTYSLYLNRRVATGEISLLEAHSDPDRDLLISHLGQEFPEHIDCNITPYLLESGDKLLVCSDGIHNWLNDHEIKSCLALSPDEAVNAFESSISAKGDPNQDNFSALILEYAQEPTLITRSTRYRPTTAIEVGFWKRISWQYYLLLIPVFVLLVTGLKWINDGFQRQDVKDEPNTEKSSPKPIPDASSATLSPDASTLHIPENVPKNELQLEPIIPPKGNEAQPQDPLQITKPDTNSNKGTSGTSETAKEKRSKQEASKSPKNHSPIIKQN
jgi:protein phosphatase